MSRKIRKAKADRPNMRTLARLGAVQALYQMDMTGISLTAVIQEYEEHRLGQDIDDVPYSKADKVFFSDLLSGVIKFQREVDPIIASHLAKGWRLSRIDATLRAILRAGAYELKTRTDVPTKVIIGEYIDMAHAFFFQGEEPKVVNGILDRLAHDFRVADVAETTGAPETSETPPIEADKVAES